MCTKFNQTWIDRFLGQGLPGTPEDYQHGVQGGPRERGLEGALHEDYYAICSPKCAPNLTKLGRINVQAKDYHEHLRTANMDT